MTPTHCAHCGHPVRNRNMPASEAPGTRIHQGRGLCARCFRDPTIHAQYEPMRTPSTCTVEVCDRQAKAKGLCSGHYARLRKGQPLDTPIGNQGTRQEGLCITPGCRRPVKAQYLCTRHYDRARRLGTLEATTAPRPTPPPRPTRKAEDQATVDPTPGLNAYLARRRARLNRRTRPITPRGTRI